MVLSSLSSTGKTLVQLSRQEMTNFCGNCLELEGENGTSFLAISKRAIEALTLENKKILEKHLRFITVDLQTIEKVGGGGFRCMLAGVHLNPV